MYALEFTRSSKKELKNIDKYQQSYILDSLEEFVDSFSSQSETRLMKSGKIKKLQGQKELLCRLKLRSYRVVYKKYKDRLLILVLHVTTREDAHR